MRRLVCRASIAPVMRAHARRFHLLLFSTTTFFACWAVFTTVPAHSAPLSEGAAAPNFELAVAPGGERFDLSSDAGDSMTFLVFFKPGAKASMWTVDKLSELYGDQSDQGIVVAGIGKGESAADLTAAARDVRIPILQDPGKVQSEYGVGSALPMTYVLDGKRKVLDVLQGAGKGVVKLLVRIADREVRRNPEIARKAARSALEEQPTNAEARLVIAETYLAEGTLDRASEELDLIDESAPPAKARKKLGKARVALSRGDVPSAKILASEAKSADPASTEAEVVSALVKVQEGQVDEGMSQLKRVASADTTGVFFRELAHVTRGELLTRQGNNEQAVAAFSAATAVNPISPDAATGAGVALRAMGRPDEARAHLERATQLAPADEIALGLLERLVKAQEAQADADRRAYIQRTVASLVERAKENAAADSERADEWTSRPMGVAILPLRSLGLPPRPGTTELLAGEVADQLRQSGRVQVVEREILDALLAELNLATSELAEPDAALRLGRILSARLILAGTLTATAGGHDLRLRAIDTETTEVRATGAQLLSPAGKLSDSAAAMANGLLTQIAAKYPLRGQVVEVDGASIVVDLGSRLGAKVGQTFDALGEGKPVKVRGKIVGHRRSKAGAVRLVDVQEGFSVGELVEGSVEPDMKLEVRK